MKQCNWTDYGQCEEVCVGDFCKKHTGLKCVVCQSPATHGCPCDYGSLLCGVPLCENCEACADPNKGFGHGHKRKSDPPIAITSATIQKKIDQHLEVIAKEQKKIDDLIFQNEMNQLGKL